MSKKIFSTPKNDMELGDNSALTPPPPPPPSYQEATISLRVSSLKDQIAASQNEVNKIIDSYKPHNQNKQAKKNSLSPIKYDTNTVNQILTLSNLKQSLATNQIMLIFQQQAEILQAQVDRKSSAYVEYNSEEKKLIAKIQQEATALYDKGVKLDKLVAEGANQKRADKLENSALLDTEFKGLNSNLRNRDKGLKLTKVKQHYSLDDLKVILKQFQKANKEMDGLLKMPDLSKRCGLLASLYDGASTLAKKAVFLVPQTAVAALAVIEYGIATVLYDTLKQGLTSAKEAGKDMWEKRYIATTILQRNYRILKSIDDNRQKTKEFVQDFITKADAIIKELPNDQVKNQYTKLKEDDNMSDIDKVKLIYQIINEPEELLFSIKQLDDRQEQLEKLDAQLNKAKAGLFPRVASAILGVPAAVLWGGIAGAATIVAVGAGNATVNVPEGVKRNYKSKATEKVTSDENHCELKNKAWNKSISKIHTRDKNDRNVAYESKVQAAEATKILANEAKGSKTKSSEFKPAESVVNDEFVRQDGNVNLKEYIKTNKDNIENKEQVIQQSILGLQSLITPATPESYIKNTVLKNDQELLNEVVELTKLKQQNAVSNIMLVFAEQAASLEQQDYADKPKEKKLNDEIQDLMQNLAAKASLLEDKIDKEISGKRADRLNKNDLEEQLKKALNPKNIPNQDMLNAEMGNYNLKVLKRIRDVYKKANKQMDALIKMPDVSQRCGLLAALYDRTTALAKSAVFLVPKTVVAAVSIVEYAVMTVVVDTIEQGLTSMKNAGEKVWAKRDKFVNDRINERTNMIRSRIEETEKTLTVVKAKFMSLADKKIKGVNDVNKKNKFNDIKEKGNLSEINNFVTNLITDSLSLKKMLAFDRKSQAIRSEIANLEEQSKDLKAKLEKAAKDPLLSFATTVLAVPVAALWGGLSGVAEGAWTGIKNVTFNAPEGKQFDNKWKKHTTDGRENKKSWARDVGEVQSDDSKARGKIHKDKAKRGAAAKVLAERAKSKGNTDVPGH